MISHQRAVSINNNNNNNIVNSNPISNLNINELYNQYATTKANNKNNLMAANG